jgi:hypothetical protein
MASPTEGYLYLFVLVSRPNESWLQCLKNSAQLNGRILSFQFTATGTQILCTCLLDGVAFGSSQGSTRNKAKLMAVKNTVRLMETLYPTIQVISPYNSTKISSLNLDQENFEQLLIHEILAFACDPSMDVLSFQVAADKVKQVETLHQVAYQFAMKSNAEYKTLEGGEPQVNVWITKQTNILQVYYHLRAGGLSPKYKLK